VRTQTTLGAWVAVAAGLILLSPARADVLQTRYENALTVEPIDLLTGTLNLQYERALIPAVSGYVGFNYLYFSGYDEPNAGTQLAIGPEIGLRLYLVGRAPAGLWIGPDLGTAYVENLRNGEHTVSLGFSGVEWSV
jgi:hypothetical protein